VIELFEDSEQFARHAGPLLESTVLNTVLATVLHGVFAGHYGDSSPRFAVVTDGAGEVTGAALRTPPWPLVCTALSAADAGELMQLWLVEDRELSGVSAALATSRALAAAWSRLTGGTTSSVSSWALHSLDPEGLRDPHRPARGYLRVPTAEDRAGVVAWDQAAIKEMGVDASPEHAARMAHRRIDDGRELVWDDGGPVALVGHTPMIAGVPRIGPVYTPPDRRGRGYASSAVAALSRQLFETGARQIVLFTDLANPTSNRIYADVGYRRIADWEVNTLNR